MAILPVRDLGSAGVITDTPHTTFRSTPSRPASTSGSMRARCACADLQESERTASVSPHVTLSASFRQQATTLWSWSLTTTRSTNTPSGTVTNRSGSITGSSDPRPFTTTQLADVVYINRPDRVPVFRGPAGTNFADLPNWPLPSGGFSSCLR